MYNNLTFTEALSLSLTYVLASGLKIKKFEYSHKPHEIHYLSLTIVNEPGEKIFNA